MKIEKLEKKIGTKIYVDTYQNLGKQYNMCHGTVIYRQKKGLELSEKKLWGEHSKKHFDYINAPEPKTTLDVYLKRTKRGYDFKIAIDPTIDLRKRENKFIS